jgi:membrane-associated phospholipid phosphatase
VPGLLTGPSDRERSSTMFVFAVAVVLPLTVLLTIAGLVKTHSNMQWDVYLLRLAARHHRPRLTAAMKTFTTFGSFLVVSLLTSAAVVVLLLVRAWRQALFVAVAVSSAVLLNLWLKVLFHRRPPNVVHPLLAPDKYSFPSGHTMSATALATALIIIAWPTRWRWVVTPLALAYAFLVGVSRVYLGMHFPSDVLGGWALSLALVTGIYLVLESVLGKEQP